jgi:hypothetical protein
MSGKIVRSYSDRFALARTSAEHALCHVIPVNHKWLCYRAVSQIVAGTMEEKGLKPPSTRMNLVQKWRKYHAADIARQIDGPTEPTRPPRCKR